MKLIIVMIMKRALYKESHEVFCKSSREEKKTTSIYVECIQKTLSYFYSELRRRKYLYFNLFKDVYQRRQCLK